MVTDKLFSLFKKIFLTHFKSRTVLFFLVDDANIYINIIMNMISKFVVFFATSIITLQWRSRSLISKWMHCCASVIRRADYYIVFSVRAPYLCFLSGLSSATLPIWSWRGGNKIIWQIPFVMSCTGYLSDTSPSTNRAYSSTNMWTMLFCRISWNCLFHRH